MLPAMQPATAIPVLVTISRLHTIVLLHMYKQPVAPIQDTLYWCV